LKRKTAAFIRPFLAPAACLVVLMVPAAHAAGSAESGRAKSMTCAACHGPDGNSLNPQWPNLAGQHATYIVRMLKAFKSGERENVLMSGQAMTLSEQDMEDLAAYFESQVPSPRTADPDLVTQGERLFRGGNKDTGVSACAACHGPNGKGNGPAGFPVLAGQHAVYVAAQLHAYKKGQRKTDNAQMMRNIAARLTDDEIEAVASYIQGLR